jgi:hypothetical protein
LHATPAYQGETLAETGQNKAFALASLLAQPNVITDHHSEHPVGFYGVVDLCALQLEPMETPSW